MLTSISKWSWGTGTIDFFYHSSNSKEEGPVSCSDIIQLLRSEQHHTLQGWGSEKWPPIQETISWQQTLSNKALASQPPFAGQSQDRLEYISSSQGVMSTKWWPSPCLPDWTLSKPRIFPRFGQSNWPCGVVQTVWGVLCAANVTCVTELQTIFKISFLQY